MSAHDKMKTYVSEIEIRKWDFDRINKLMKVNFDGLDEDGEITPYMQELIYELDARPEIMQYGFWFEFEDGSSIYIDICSGTHNYYDNCQWVSGDKEKDYLFDCGYVIEEENVFVPFDGDTTYICKFIIKED